MNALYRLFHPTTGALLALALLLGPPRSVAAQSAIANVPTGLFPESVAVNTTTNRAYVTNDGDFNVSVYDVSNPIPVQIGSPIPMGAGVPPQGVDVNSQTNRIYVNLGGAVGGTAVIDGATSTVLTTLPTGAFGTGVAVDETRNIIYTASTGTNTVAVINGNTNTFTTIPVAAIRNDPNNIAVNPVTNRVYVTAGNGVAVLDRNANSVTQVPVTAETRGVAVNSALNRIYVSNNAADSVTVLNGADSSTITTVPVGDGPSGMAFHPGTNRVYVTNFNAGTVTILDAGTNAPVPGSPVNVQTNPRAVDVNPFNSRVYVVNFGSNSMTAILDALTPAISISDATVTEGNNGVTNATFTVTLSSPLAQEVTVRYRTVDGTATAGADYTAVPDTVLTFAPVETSKAITVQILGDLLDEPNETFFVNLSSPTNSTLADAQGLATIVDDDEPAPTASTLTVALAGTGTGTVGSSPAGILCATDCSEAYAAGTVVTLNARPARNSLFAGWSGDGCVGTGPCTVTMSAARTITATFTRPSCLGQPATIVGAGNISGTAANDVIVGSNGPDLIDGRAGNDLICALGGNDLVVAGPGNDIVDGGEGHDVVRGGPGNDVLVGRAGQDRLFGGDGIDRLVGEAGDDRLFGEGGNDILNGGPGRDICDGGAGRGDVAAPNCEARPAVP